MTEIESRVEEALAKRERFDANMNVWTDSETDRTIPRAVWERAVADARAAGWAADMKGRWFLSEGLDWQGAARQVDAPRWTCRLPFAEKPLCPHQARVAERRDGAVADSIRWWSIPVRSGTICVLAEFISMRSPIPRCHVHRR